MLPNDKPPPDFTVHCEAEPSQTVTFLILRCCLHSSLHFDDVLFDLFLAHLIFLSFQNLVKSSSSFDHPFSLALVKSIPSCSKFCPFMLLLCDSCQAVSAITTVFLAARFQNVLCLSTCRCITLRLDFAAPSPLPPARNYEPMCRSSLAIRPPFLCPLWLRPPIPPFVEPIHPLFFSFLINFMPRCFRFFEMYSCFILDFCHLFPHQLLFCLLWSVVLLAIYGRPFFKSVTCFFFFGETEKWTATYDPFYLVNSNGCGSCVCCKLFRTHPVPCPVDSGSRWGLPPKSHPFWSPLRFLHTIHHPHTSHPEEARSRHVASPQGMARLIV